MDILEFKDDYYFLSNFYEKKVTYQGLTFRNNEAAFQAMKCPERMKEFCNLNPSAAKRLGRSVKLRTDWEEIKETIMYEICMAKFSQHPDLARKLIDTGDGLLVEGNFWGDRVWGVCDGTGNNKLGKILMKIRSKLKEMNNGEFCVCCGASLGDAELGRQVCFKCSGGIA